MSHEAKFKQGDTIVNESGRTAVVRDAEPDDDGFIFVNAAENPDSEKVWWFVRQDGWTKVKHYPVRWLVFDSDGRVVADVASLEAALNYTNTFGPRRILHIRKDGTTEWIDIQEEG